MEMTEITIRIPQAGAMRLIEESVKAGVSPDRFIAMLIEERLKRPSTPPPPEAPPELNAEGLGMLRKMLGGPGGPPGGAKAKRAKAKKRNTRK